ncbi:hypothetical protein LguiB_018758 [Lonicera macranthoides]
MNKDETTQAPISNSNFRPEKNNFKKEKKRIMLIWPAISQLAKLICQFLKIGSQENSARLS